MEGPNTIAEIDISEKKNKGSVKLTCYPKSIKSKDIKLQVNNIRGHDKTFVGIFSEKILKNSIDKILSGATADSLFKNPLNKTIKDRCKCDICGKTFTNTAQKNKHMKADHNKINVDDQYQKENIYVLRQSTEDIKELIQEASKTPVKHLQCPQCNLNFINANILRKHMVEHHKGSRAIPGPRSKRDRLTRELSTSPSTTPPPKKVILEQTIKEKVATSIPEQSKTTSVDKTDGANEVEHTLPLAVRQTTEEEKNEDEGTILMDAETVLSKEEQKAMVLSDNNKVDAIIAEMNSLRERLTDVENKLAQKEVGTSNIKLLFDTAETTALVTDLTKENEKLSEENKTLKTIAKGVEASNTPLPDDNDEEEEFLTREEEIFHQNKKRGFKRTSPMSNSQTSVEYPCTLCNLVFKTKTELEMHVKAHSQVVQYTCTSCEVISRTKTEQENHMKTHQQGLDNMSELQRAAADIEEGVKCNTCKKHLKDMGELRNHRKTEHIKYKPCRNFPGTSPEDRCKWGDRCDWKHSFRSADTPLCWTCGQIFTNKSTLAYHRKNEHNGTGPCKYNDLPGGCIRSDSDCHYLHIQSESSTRETHVSKPQDFRQGPSNTAPPNLTQEKDSMLDIMKQYMMQQQQMAQQQQQMAQQVMTILSQ